MSHTISSAYGRVVQTALREPVSITNHGREHLVLLSAEEYHRLKRFDRTALYPWELDDATLSALTSAEPPADTAAFDHETYR